VASRRDNMPLMFQSKMATIGTGSVWSDEMAWPRIVPRQEEGLD